MKFKKWRKYDFSVYARGEGELTVSLGIVIDEHKASFEVEPFNEAAAVIKCNSKDDWKKYSVTFTADEELESDGSGLIVTNTGDSDLDVDMVSLMPEDTYKGHGLRKDLMEQLEAMHPKFLRFPGGCAVEGQTMDTAWNWKDTIGDVSERKEMINIWNPVCNGAVYDDLRTWFYEYFKCARIWVWSLFRFLNCGIACQVRSGSATDEEHLVLWTNYSRILTMRLTLSNLQTVLMKVMNGCKSVFKWDIKSRLYEVHRYRKRAVRRYLL